MRMLVSITDFYSILLYHLSNQSLPFVFIYTHIFFCFAFQRKCVLPSPMKVSLMNHLLKDHSLSHWYFCHWHLSFLPYLYFHSSAFNGLIWVHQTPNYWTLPWPHWIFMCSCSYVHYSNLSALSPILSFVQYLKIYGCNDLMVAQ